MTIQITLLGPLAAAEDDAAITPSARRPQQLLALLALNEGRMVESNVLIDEVWGDWPPASCTATLQTYIRRLRRSLDGAPESGKDGSAVVTFAGGYGLNRNRVVFDVTSYREWAARGHVQREQGNHDAAVESMRRALAAHRGPILDGLAAGRPVQIEREQLDEDRLTLHETCIESEIACGRHEYVRAELAALTTANPEREHLWGLYIMALARSGQADFARRVYDQVDRSMQERCGLTPSPKLQRLRVALTS